MLSRSTASGVLTLCLTPGFLAAQTGETLPSGPKAGTTVAAVKVYAPVGARAGREYDALSVIGQEAGALLFIHELTRNTAPVIRGLDRLAEEYSLLGLENQTVFLSADRTQAEVRLKAVNGSLKLREPIVLSLDGAEGPGTFALDRKCTLTLVLVNAGKVVRSVGLTDTGQNDVPVLRKWIEEITGPMPKGDALRKLIAARMPRDPDALREHAVRLELQVRRLQNQLQRQRQQGNRRRDADPNMRQRGMDRKREGGERRQDANPLKRRFEGKAPEDRELQGLLRSFIRKTNSDEQVDDVFARIEKRAGESDTLRSQSVEMFRLVLSLKDRYGTAHAHELAERYMRRHAAPDEKENKKKDAALVDRRRGR